MIPTQLTLSSIQEAFRDIYSKLDPLRANVVDLKGRRYANAGQPVDVFDYVRLFDLDERVKAFSIAQQERLDTALTITTVVRVGLYATRGSAVAHANTLFFASDRDYISFVSNGATWSYDAGVHRDTFANRPTPTSDEANYAYFATDTFQRFYWTGSAWVEEIAPAFLPFLGLTTSFPAWKRSSAILQARLADDSAHTDVEVADEAYDATAWNASLEVPTKNAVRDKFESLPVLASGVYTPTISAVVNVDASTAYECQYLRVGNTVTVSGQVDIDATASGALTAVGISLPIASNLGGATDCAGAGAAYNVQQSGAVMGDLTNDRGQLTYMSTSTANESMFFHFSYQII